MKLLEKAEEKAQNIGNESLCYSNLAIAYILRDILGELKEIKNRM